MTAILLYGFITFVLFIGHNFILTLIRWWRMIMTLHYRLMPFVTHHCLRKWEEFQMLEIGEENPHHLKTYGKIVFYLSWLDRLSRFNQENLLKVLSTAQICLNFLIPFFPVVQFLSPVWLFATPWAAICQASLPFPISWILPQFFLISCKCGRIESSGFIIPSCHIFCPMLGSRM